MNSRQLFVTPHIAQLLKDNGFQEPCLAAYDRLGILTSHSKIGSSAADIFSPINYNAKAESQYCSVPTWGQCTDWFRNNHNLNISILPYKHPEEEGKVLHEFMIFKGGESDGYTYSGYEAYYKALEEVIIKAFREI